MHYNRYLLFFIGENVSKMASAQWRPFCLSINALDMLPSTVVVIYFGVTSLVCDFTHIGS